MKSNRYERMRGSDRYEGVRESEREWEGAGTNVYNVVSTAASS